MISNYEINLWLLSFFSMLFGMLFLFVSRKTSPKEEEGGMNVRLFLFLFSLIFFAFAQYSIYAAIVYNIDLGGFPECENLLNTSTTIAATTTYTYMNSCTGTPPPAQVSFLQAYGWVLWIEAIVLLIGSFFIIIARIARRW